MQTIVAIAHQTDSAPKPAATETITIPTESPTPSPIPVTPTETPIPSPIPVLPTDTQLPTPTATPAQPVSGVLRFHFVNVGQGDATVIQAPDGKIMLIDGGDPNTGIVQYLQSIGVQRIDLMVATHPSSDHIQVLQSFPVTMAIYYGEAYTTSTMVELAFPGLFGGKQVFLRHSTGLAERSRCPPIQI